MAHVLLPHWKGPYGPLSTGNDSFSIISIYHPAYPPPRAEPLLHLPALDPSLDENDHRHGIQYDVALVACGIIANNRWKDAYFTATPDGLKIERPPGGLLCDSVYYFHIAGTTALQRYPIVPNFESWQYPHAQSLPQSWQNFALRPKSELQEDIAQATLDTSPCCLTECWVSVHKAHIVPKSTCKWFMKRMMSRLALTPRKHIHDVLNHIPLRSDVHTAFDSPKFCIIPKRISADLQVPLQLAAHVITTETKMSDCELRTAYHNRPIHTPTNMAREFLFARFAWTILTNRTVFPFFLTPEVSFAIYLDDGSTAERAGDDIDQLVRPAKSTPATCTSDAATGNTNTKKCNAPTDNSTDSSESDSHCHIRPDSTRDPDDKSGMVRAWLARTMPMEASKMPMEASKMPMEAFTLPMEDCMMAMESDMA